MSIVMLAQGNNDWMQLIIPIIVFVLYSAANMMKTSADRKSKTPTGPMPIPRPRPVAPPADASPQVLLELDPLQQAGTKPTGPVKPTPQQLELERLLRELGVPKGNTQAQPTPPRVPPRRPPQNPKGTKKGSSPATSKPPAAERASQRHLKSDLEKRHAEAPRSKLEKQHLESNVEHRPLDTQSAVDPALLVAQAHAPRISSPAMVTNLRQAFMMSVVLGPPLAMRDEPTDTTPLL
jgi:hypothetical protein